MKSSRIPLGLFLFFSLCQRGSGQPDVIINEIMYAPAGGKPEWIELFNRSGSPVSLQGWILHDATASRPVITGESVLIAPGGYLVITRDTSILVDDPTLQASLVVMEKFPSLNNTGDEVVLRRPDSSKEDSVRFATSWGGQGGLSLERIDNDRPGASQGNWRTSVDPTGSTPARRNSVAILARDLAIPRVMFDPPLPRTGSPAAFHVTIRNEGRLRADSFTITIHEDIDKDGMTSESELLSETRVVTDLSPGDTMDIDGIIPASDSIVRIMVTAVAFPGDERPVNNARSDTMYCTSSTEGIVINEIMYAPSGGEPEWIEILNSRAVAADLNGWSIGDNATWHTMPSSAARIDPGGYLVLCSSADLAAYHPDMPGRFLVTSLPSLNNTGDEVRLRDRTGFIVDSVRYTPAWGGAGGCSLERRNAIGPSGAPVNWGSSESPGGSTPGRVNSIVTIPRDLAVFRMEYQGRDLTVTVLNTGLETSTSTRIVLHLDRNADGSAQKDERIFDETVPDLAPLDSVRVPFPGAAWRPGRWTFIACIEDGAELRRRNDTGFLPVTVPIPRGMLSVNEIMCEPLHDEAEWVEYLNTTDTVLNVDGCYLAGGYGGNSSRIRISDNRGSVGVPASGYLVVASDSSILLRFPSLAVPRADRTVVMLDRSSLNLRNDDGGLMFIDPLDNIVDSIRYSMRWHHPAVVTTAGHSLERINPSLPAGAATSWTTSSAAAGGTPGERNAAFSEFPRQSGGQTSLVTRPNPFSPDHDGYQDHCVIAWTLPTPAAHVRIRIFDSMGRMVRTLSDVSFSGASGEVVWDGYGDDSVRQRVGIYIVILDAVDSGTNTAYQEKTVVVIAGRM